MAVIRHILNILISADITLTAILGGKRYETLSASAWLGEQQGKILPSFFRPIIDLLFLPFDGRGHCQKSFESEERLFQRPRQ